MAVNTLLPFLYCTKFVGPEQCMAAIKPIIMELIFLYCCFSCAFLQMPNYIIFYWCYSVKYWVRQPVFCWPRGAILTILLYLESVTLSQLLLTWYVVYLAIKKLSYLYFKSNIEGCYFAVMFLSCHVW